VTRKSTGKRLRFEVFKRDHFTCQYCGAQPPDVVLVVDHITPVSAGGDNDPTNLISACEPCNQGKSDKPLGDRIIRPDADLLYLETQQEISEIKRYQESIVERLRSFENLIAFLQGKWCHDSGLDWNPADHIIRQLLNKYGHEAAGEALEDVSLKIAGGYLDDSDDKWVRYLFAVARNLSADEEQEVV
jgi:hypothetical protein